MKRILKYDLHGPDNNSYESEFELNMPAWFVPVHIGLQGGKVKMWAIAHDNAEIVPYRFLPIATGQELPEYIPRHAYQPPDAMYGEAIYAGTAVMESEGRVWHYFYYPYKAQPDYSEGS